MLCLAWCWQTFSWHLILCFTPLFVYCLPSFPTQGLSLSPQGLLVSSLKMPKQIHCLICWCCCVSGVWRGNNECQFLSLPWEFLSFTQEWIFGFKLIFFLQRLTLLVKRITFKSIHAEKVFVLLWALNILLRRIFSFYWVLLNYWEDWFSSNRLTQLITLKRIWFYLVLFFSKQSTWLTYS